MMSDVRRALERLRRRLRPEVWFALVGAWLLHYLDGVARIRLHFGSHLEDSDSKEKAVSRMRRIMSSCPTFGIRYWPTWFAHTALQQFMLLGLKELRARLLQRSPYRRQVLSLSDGAKIALDWVDVPGGLKPNDGGAKGDRSAFQGAEDRDAAGALALESEWNQKSSARGGTSTNTSGALAPACVLLHGAIQDSASVTMIDLARVLADRGMPVVVMNRRGYGGLPLTAETTKLALFGLDTDLDEVFHQVHLQYPGRDVALIGFSCGSGYCGRYAGSHKHMSAWPENDNLHRHDYRSMPRLLCAVAYDPGYDVSPSGVVSRIRPPYSWMLNWAIKYQYVLRHRAPLREKSESSAELVKMAMLPKDNLHETYRRVRRLSGAGDSSAYLDLQQTKLDAIGVPSLLINSRDDPICVWENVDIHFQDIGSNPNLVLAEMKRGSHGCKFDLWGWRCLGNEMIGEFVSAAWTELRHARSTR